MLNVKLYKFNLANFPMSVMVDKCFIMIKIKYKN